MRKLGLSKQKTAYIRDLARHTRDGTVDFAELPGLPDAEVIERLTKVKGVGVWTAHMFLIFALRRTNVLPSGDLGIRSAIRKAYGLPELPKPAEIEALGRALASLLHRGGWYLVCQPQYQLRYRYQPGHQALRPPRRHGGLRIGNHEENEELIHRYRGCLVSLAQRFPRS
jgi:3-methyladenine DNA glycosylase/8-oxoguanine DNA glycosylase